MGYKSRPVSGYAVEVVVGSASSCPLIHDVSVQNQVSFDFLIIDGFPGWVCACGGLATLLEGCTSSVAGAGLRAGCFALVISFPGFAFRFSVNSCPPSFSCCFVFFS